MQPAPGDRSTGGASACCSRSKALPLTPKTTGSAGPFASGRRRSRSTETSVAASVTSHDPDTGVTDLDTLGTLARYRPDGRVEPLPFGVYGTVTVPGRVSVGDTLRVNQ